MSYNEQEVVEIRDLCQRLNVYDDTWSIVLETNDTCIITVMNNTREIEAATLQIALRVALTLYGAA